MSREARARLRLEPALCTACRTCQLWCSLSHEGQAHPDLARLTVSARAGDYLRLDEACNGCGVCARVCPTGAVTMRERLRERRGP